MSRHVLNFIKKVGFILVFYINNFNMCAFGYVVPLETKFDMSLKSIQFFNDRVELKNLFFNSVINVGECEKVQTHKLYLYSIVYVDKSDFLNPKLCICAVDSCQDLPVDQLHWSSKCKANALCQKMINMGHMPFCTVFVKNNTDVVKFVPIEFSRQTFFNPGIRLIVDANGTLYKQDYFLSGSNFTKRDFKITFAGKLYEFKIYRSGYNQICADYYNQVELITQCVPFPVLSRVMLSQDKYGKVKIQFGDMTSKQPIHVDDHIMSNFGIRIVKPKINFDNHQFYLYEECLDGEILGSGEYCLNGKVRYQHDDKITVKCVDGVNVTSGYVLKTRQGEYDRHIWLKSLPNNMIRYVRTKEKKYIQCADYEYDITNKAQDFLDSMLINQDNYYIFFDKQNRIHNLYRGDNPCHNLSDSYYLYQNTRLRIKDNKPKQFPPEIFTQFVGSDDKFEVLRYFDIDNRKILSLSTELQNELQFLDYHSMGMCIDNFRSTTYAVALDNSIVDLNKGIAENSRHVDVLLHYPKLTDIYNIPSKCNFIKVEIWGGGQSGMIDVEHWKSKEGKPGEYVMGMFKINGSDEYFIKVKLEGIHAQVFDNGRNVGVDAIVDFCRRSHGEEVCEVRLMANGAGKFSDEIRERVQGNSKVYDKRMLYYRVVDSTVDRKLENIPSNQRIRFIPYKDFTNEMRWEKLRKDECRSGKILAENNSEYFGAGGCADVNTHSTEKGAGSIVKITCEDWYHQ